MNLSKDTKLKDLTLPLPRHAHLCGKRRRVGAAAAALVACASDGHWPREEKFRPQEVLAQACSVGMPLAFATYGLMKRLRAW